MFAVGHIALGHLAAKITNGITKQNLNIPLIWTISLLPDLDFLIPGIPHRGPTHSLILLLLAFTPLIITKKEKIIPYLTAALTHTLIGDLPTGGVQLLWPVTTKWIQYPIKICMKTPLEANIELLLFISLIATLIISKDYKHLLNSDGKNTLLLIPLITILLPITSRYPVPIPKTLIVPHITLLGIVALSILKTVKHQITKLRYRPQTLKL